MAKVVDGILYRNEADAPDLGSLVNVAEIGSITRSYRGKEADASKLPTVTRYPQYSGVLESGSLFIATDTRKSKMYDKSDDSWS